jgi:uncharacterized membrane protein
MSGFTMKAIKKVRKDEWATDSDSDDDGEFGLKAAMAAAKAEGTSAVGSGIGEFGAASTGPESPSKNKFSSAGFDGGGFNAFEMYAGDSFGAFGSGE